MNDTLSQVIGAAGKGHVGRVTGRQPTGRRQAVVLGTGLSGPAWLQLEQRPGVKGGVSQVAS